MNDLRQLAYALLAATLFPAVLSAQATTWKIDPAHSGVEFQIRHLGVSNVRGSLSSPAGTVHLDDKDITKSSVEAKIDASSINTHENKRDEHLRSPDFFDVQKYPTINFKSTSLTNVDGKLKMIGDLTLAGVTKSVALSVDGPAAPQKGMGGAMVSGFSASGVIHRPDFNFGSKYGSPLLGEDVKFTIDIEMSKQ